MARKLLIRTSKAPYHITGRSNNKEFFYLDLETLWQIFMLTMKQTEALYNCHFHAFVLMSNHYHLLISTPFENVDKVMEHLQREVARKANLKTARINHFFGGPYKWSIIYDENYYWNAVKYIFRNPIRSGLCKEVTQYPYSSLNRESRSLEWKMVDFFNNKSGAIVLDKTWLNEPFLSEQEEALRLGLRRKEFKISQTLTGHIPPSPTAFSKK